MSKQSRRRAHNDGGIDKRGENAFRLRYRVNGKRCAETFHGTLTEAKARLRDLLNSADKGAHVDPTKLTLAQWAEQWIAAGAPGRKKRKVTDRSVQRYEELLRCHVLPVLGARPIQKLQAIEIDRVYTGLAGKMAPRTAAHVHSVFNA